MAYSATASSTVTYNRAKYKPHDKLTVRVAKSALNCAAGNILATAQSVNMSTVPAGSLILAVNIDVTTAEGANTGVDIGLAGGVEFCINGNSAVATQTVMLGVPYLIQSASKVTLTTNGAALNNAIVDCYVCYVEFDSLTAAN